MFDYTGGDLDQALADSRELGTGERVCRRNRSAHPMHQPVRGSVEYEPDLIGDRGQQCLGTAGVVKIVGMAGSRVKEPVIETNGFR